MPTLFLLLFLLHLASATPNTVPLFNSCVGGLRCEGTAVCRFNICLPPSNPVPIYAHGNKTFTLQPNQAPKIAPATVRPVQNIQNVVVQAPQARITVASCQPACLAQASCVQGSCRCSTGVFYSPSGRLCLSLFRSSNASRPSSSSPCHTPGETCIPGSECTGGSVCSSGICTCPPELIQQGGVCVSSAVLGLPHRGLPGYQ